MRINFNISAVIANNSLLNNEDNLTKAIERLSSGNKINSAKDDPASFAISSRMNLQLKALEKATQNASNGISVIQTAEGALAEMHDMAGRMKELAVKASNGSLKEDDREAVQKEIDALKDEIDRIAKTTEYNSQPLLDGSQDLKGYTDINGVRVNFYSDETRVDDYRITNIVSATYDANGNLLTNASAELTNKDGTAIAGYQKSSEGDFITFTGLNGFEIKIEVDPDVYGGAPTAGTVELMGFGDMKLQVGSSEGQTLDIRIPKVSTQNMGLDNMDVTSQASAKKAMELADKATSFISEIRSRLGAYENRLEHTISSLDVSTENLTKSYSKIMDTDMATEMTTYTQYQVLTQAGTSMLAQANQRPEAALQLLQ